MRKSRSRLFKVCMVSFIVFFVLAILVGFSACSGCNEEEDDDPTVTPPETTVAVSGVTVAPTSLELTVGDTSNLTATVTMSDGTTSTSQTVTWKSEDESVAKVSGTGTTGAVTAEGAGETTITASVGSVTSDAVKVTVKAVPTLGITLSAATLDLSTATGGTSTGTLTATLAMSDNSTVPSGTSLTWESSDETVAKVTADESDSKSATVEAKGNGIATVTAKADDATATCTVYVVGPAQLVLDSSDAALMNAQGTQSSASSTLMSVDATSGAITNVTAGDEIVFQLSSSAEASSVTATVNVPTGSDATGLELYVNDATTAETLTSGAATIALVEGVNYLTLKAGASVTTGTSVSGITLDWNQTKVTTTSGTIVKTTTTTIEPSIESVVTGGKVFDVGADGKATLEAEDAALMNAVGSSGSTNVIKTETSTSTGVTQVANFNVEGDTIVFQVNATAAVDVTLAAYVYPSTDSFDAALHADFIKVNGQSAALTNYEDLAKGAYGALTATVALSAGINYIEIVCDTTGTSMLGMNMGFMNVDRIELTSYAAVAIDKCKDANSLKYDNSNSLEGYNYVIKTRTDADGNVVYVLDGTASEMDASIAQWFGDGAKAGDEYVTVKIYVGASNSISYTSNSSIEKTIAGSSLESDGYYYYFAYRLSGLREDGTPVVPSASKSYTISDSTGKTIETVTIDYTKVEVTGKSIDAVAVPNTCTDKEALKIGDSEYISGGTGYTITKTTDSQGDVVYVLEGVASNMTSAVATWFGDGAQAGDEYIVVKIYVGSGNTLTYTSYDREKTVTSTDLESDGYYYFVYRFSGTHADGSAVVPASAKEYTISDSTGKTIEVVTIDYTDIVVKGSSIDGLAVPDETSDSSSLLIDETNSVEVGSYTIEKFTDAEGNIVYVLEGEAANMSEAVAAWFGDGAYAGDAYVTVKIYVGENNTLIYTSNSDEEKTIAGSSLASDGYYYYFAYRLSGVRADGTAVTPSDAKTYTIKDANGKVVETITIDYTKLVFKAVGDLEVPDPEGNCADKAAMGVPNSSGSELFEGYDYTITVTTDSSGDVVYVLEGVASNMTSDVATWFGDGAQAGDAYVMVKIYVGSGNTISYVSAGGEKKSYTNSENAQASMFDGEYYFFVYRLSGSDASGKAVTPSSSKTYTITSGEKTTSITVTIDFSQITFSAIDSLMVPDATVDANDLKYDNTNSVEGYNYTIGKTTDESGNVTYTLYGTASAMTSGLATWFGSGAAEGDAYVTVKIYVGTSNSISYTSSNNEEKTYSGDALTSDGYYIFVYRLSGTGVTPSSAKTYTITDSTNSTTTTVTIDYTQIVIAAEA